MTDWTEKELRALDSSKALCLGDHPYQKGTVAWALSETEGVWVGRPTEYVKIEKGHPGFLNGRVEEAKKEGRFELPNGVLRIPLGRSPICSYRYAYTERSGTAYWVEDGKKLSEFAVANLPPTDNLRVLYEKAQEEGRLRWPSGGTYVAADPELVGKIPVRRTSTTYVRLAVRVEYTTEIEVPADSVEEAIEAVEKHFRGNPASVSIDPVGIRR